MSDLKSAHGFLMKKPLKVTRQPLPFRARLDSDGPCRRFFPSSGTTKSYEVTPGHWNSLLLSARLSRWRLLQSEAAFLGSLQVDKMLIHADWLQLFPGPYKDSALTCGWFFRKTQCILMHLVSPRNKGCIDCIESSSLSPLLHVLYSIT